MNKFKLRKLSLILLLMLALMMLLVACDGEDDDADDTPSTSAPSATEDAAPTEEAAAPTAEVEAVATEVMEAMATEEAAAPVATEAMEAMATEEAAAPVATEAMEAMATEVVEVAAAPTEEAAMPTAEVEAVATEVMEAMATEEAAAPVATEAVEAPVAVASDAQTIAAVIAGNRIFSTLAGALDMGGLTETLAGTDQFTVFAPIDRAFSNVPAEQMSAAMSDPALLTSVLQYHVVPGVYMASDLTDGMTLDTVAGLQLAVTVDANNRVFVNGARVIIPNIVAGNGVVHALDTVLVPAMEGATAPEAAATEEAAPEAAATEEAAPEAAGTEEAAAPAAGGTIPEVAATTEGLGTLVAALGMAADTNPEAAAALSGPGPLTIFAPNDDAFAVMDADMMNSALADTAILVALLQYHVVPGEWTAETLMAEVEAAGGAFELTSALGEVLVVTVVDGQVMVNNAVVVNADVVASNGLIHVIDTVLAPPSMMPAAPEMEATLEATPES